MLSNTEAVGGLLPFQERPVLNGAGFGIRALARVLDHLVAFFIGIMGGVIGGIVIGLLNAHGSLAPGWQARLQGMNPAILGCSFLSYYTYHGLCEGISGATLGKLLCGLRVVRQDGGEAGWKGVAIRTLAYLWDSLFFGMVGYTSMQKSPLNQRYGDVWGQTTVLKKADVPPATQCTTAELLLGLFMGVTVGALIMATASVLVVVKP